MRIEVRGRGVEVGDDLRELVERRVLFALSRFGPRVHGVRVHLEDLNGPKGGVDKQCRILARLMPSGAVRVEDSDADAVVAVSRAADRLGRSVARELARRFEGRGPVAALPASDQGRA